MFPPVTARVVVMVAVVVVAVSAFAEGTSRVHVGVRTRGSPSTVGTPTGDESSTAMNSRATSSASFRLWPPFSEVKSSAASGAAQATGLAGPADQMVEEGSRTKATTWARVVVSREGVTAASMSPHGVSWETWRLKCI